jgi:phosphatidate cytidylyltransferase
MMVSKAFIQRICFGSLITFIFFLLIYYSHIPFVHLIFSASIMAVIGFSLLEYFKIVEKRGVFLEKNILLILSFFYLLSAAYFQHTPLENLVPLFFLIFTLFLTFISLIIKSKISIAAVATTILGMAWITMPLTTAYQVNYYFPDYANHQGQYWLLYILFVTKACDTFAYFIGSKLGKNPFASHISPKKTIEGALGGIAGALLMSYLFHAFSIIDISLLESIILGLVLGIVAEIGDLAESLIKRDAGVKDSNNIPGLGGVLDIVDSLLFTAPCVYFHLLLKSTGLV